MYFEVKKGDKMRDDSIDISEPVIYLMYVLYCLKNQNVYIVTSNGIRIPGYIFYYF